MATSKSKKRDNNEQPPMNLQITDKGVVAVQDFNLEIAFFKDKFAYAFAFASDYDCDA